MGLFSESNESKKKVLWTLVSSKNIDGGCSQRLALAKAEQGQGGLARAAAQMTIHYGGRRDDGIAFLPYNHIMIVIGVGVCFELGTPSVYYGNSINTNAFVSINQPEVVHDIVIRTHFTMIVNISLLCKLLSK